MGGGVGGLLKLDNRFRPANSFSPLCTGSAVVLVAIRAASLGFADPRCYPPLRAVI